MQRHTRMKVYKILARPTLCYGSEAWNIQTQDECRITHAEMKFLQRTAGYSLLDHQRNETTAKELNITPISEYFVTTGRTVYNIFTAETTLRYRNKIFATFLNENEPWADHSGNGRKL